MDFTREILFDIVCFTVGVLFIRIITFGKYPPVRIKGKVLFKTVGLLVFISLFVAVTYLLV